MNNTMMQPKLNNVLILVGISLVVVLRSGCKFTGGNPTHVA